MTLKITIGLMPKQKKERNNYSGIVNTNYLCCFSVSANGMENFEHVQHGYVGMHRPVEEVVYHGGQSHCKYLIDKPDKREVFHHGTFDNVI